VWRRYGETSYTVLVVGVITVEVLALGVLTWIFTFRLFGLGFATEVEGTLIAAVAVTAAALVALTMYILGYHTLSVAHDRRSVGRLEMWIERWVRALYDGDPPPRPPLPRDAMEAGLDLRELLKGEEGRDLTDLLEAAGVGESLLGQLGAHRLTVRLEALDGLAKARLPGTFGAVLEHLGDSRPAVRFMAARALARTLAEWTPGPTRDQAVADFAAGLERADLPPGAAGETLQLLEAMAPEVLSRLLGQVPPPVPLLKAALDAAGRLGLAGFSQSIVPLITHHDREVRAAALRALGRLGRVPPGARDAIVIALNDDTEFVRIQAARAAGRLPQRLGTPLLYQSMGDSSWWVRKASGEALLRLGTRGIAALRKASRTHTDGFARDMAAQVLLDAGLGQVRPEAQIQESA
jgi:HEAT repeat protein